MFMEAIKCQKYGSKKFKQEVSEIYDRYVDSNGKIVDLKDELTRDLEFREISRIKCGQVLEESNE